MMKAEFNPPSYLRSALAQTLLASSPIRAWGKNPMLAVAREVSLNPIADVRLQGFYSPRPNSKGLAVLLHGWEGSVRSPYILRTGRCLYENGYSVFRLNYRDHGDTHALNSGLFYAALLDEVFGAVQQAAAIESERPCYLIGFSLGGNFALRIARQCAQQPIGNLKHVVSLSPVLDPEKSTHAIDRHPLFRPYFRHKWSRSLMKKQAHFPDHYDFRDVLRLTTLAEMTEALLQKHSPYKNSADYFRHYTLVGEALGYLTLPTTIITAQDDPIIPVDDFYALTLAPSTELIVHRYGGHNGFLETVAGRAWYEKEVVGRWSRLS